MQYCRETCPQKLHYWSAGLSVMWITGAHEPTNQQRIYGSSARNVAWAADGQEHAGLRQNLWWRRRKGAPLFHLPDRRRLRRLRISNKYCISMLCVLVENNTNVRFKVQWTAPPETLNYLWALPQSSSKMLLTFFSLFVDGARTADWYAKHMIRQETEVYYLPS